MSRYVAHGWLDMRVWPDACILLLALVRGAPQAIDVLYLRVHCAGTVLHLQLCL
jgi:hypothetical protein